MKLHDPRLNIRVASNGATILAERPYSIVPGDGHLRIVLAYWDADEGYVTWIHNVDDTGFHEGHYFREDDAFSKAFDDFMTRGRKISEGGKKP